MRRELRSLSIQLDAKEHENPFSGEKRGEDELRRWKEWRKKINEDFMRVARFRRECVGLEEIRVRTSQMWDKKRRYWTAREDYLFLDGFEMMLGAPRLDRGEEVSSTLRPLTRLEIDLYAVQVIDGEGKDDGKHSRREGRHHLCPIIAQHLPTLKKLHVYLPNICPEILSALKYNKESHNTTSPAMVTAKKGYPMQDLVIKLASKGPARKLWNYALSCSHQQHEMLDTKVFRVVMVDAIRTFAADSALPLKTARVMWYPTGYNERCLERRALMLHCIDVLTGEDGVLEDDQNAYSARLEGEDHGPGEGAAEGWAWAGWI